VEVGIVNHLDLVPFAQNPEVFFNSFFDVLHDVEPPNESHKSLVPREFLDVVPIFSADEPPNLGHKELAVSFNQLVSAFVETFEHLFQNEQLFDYEPIRELTKTLEPWKLTCQSIEKGVPL